MATRKQIGWTVPGFGLPFRWPEMQSVRWQPIFQPDENTVLLSILDGSENPRFCYTVREMSMMRLIGQLTDLPGWQRRIFDPEWTSGWASTAMRIEEDFTADMAAWCIEEVKYYFHNDVQSGFVPALDGGVIKSDSCILPLLRTGLQKAIADMDSGRRTKSDGNILQHPVDPYYCAYAFEKTRTLRSGSLGLENCIASIGQGSTVAMPSEGDCVQSDPAKYPNDRAWSRRFQWLPFDIAFDRSKSWRSRISSYINNIHPIEDQSVYTHLEAFIDSTLPLFERSLMELKAPGYQNQRFHVLVLGRDPVIVKRPGSFRPPEQRAYEDLDDQGQFRDWLSVDLRREFWNIGIQMALHVKHIRLDAEHPRYEGEKYHVQGQMNERICATALYSLSAHNIAVPSLAFRRRINAEEAFVAKDEIYSPPFAEELYGAKDGDPVIQHIGDVALPQGRVVTYPHIFQTRILPFNLVDQSREGHFTLLELHLVDPNRRIMSTSMVPPQQPAWWARAVRAHSPPLWRLPNKIWEKIVRIVEYDQSFTQDEGGTGGSESMELRDEFVQEREGFQDRHTKAMMEYLQWDLEPRGGWVHV